MSIGTLVKLEFDINKLFSYKNNLLPILGTAASVNIIFS